MWRTLPRPKQYLTPNESIFLKRDLIELYIYSAKSSLDIPTAASQSEWRRRSRFHCGDTAYNINPSGISLRSDQSLLFPLCGECLTTTRFFRCDEKHIFQKKAWIKNKNVCGYLTHSLALVLALVRVSVFYEQQQINNLGPWSGISLKISLAIRIMMFQRSSFWYIVRQEIMTSDFDLPWQTPCTVYLCKQEAGNQTQHLLHQVVRYCMFSHQALFLSASQRSRANYWSLSGASVQPRTWTQELV